MGFRGKQHTSTGDFYVTWKRSPRLSTEVTNFIEALPTPEGSLFQLMPWQKSFVHKVFNTRNGKRVTRTALLNIARKNGKTGLASALVLAHLFVPRLQKRNAELYSLACDRAQAGIVYARMKGVILQCPNLLEQLNIIDFHKQITHKKNGMTYRALASDGARNQGLSVYFAVCDEVSEFKKADSFFAIKSASGFHEEALCLIISTSAADPEHVFSQEVMHARKVLAGEIEDPTYYAKIYAADPEDDIADPQTWRKANPSLGQIRLQSELERFYKQCRTLPSQLKVFKRYYLNMPGVRPDKDDDWIAPAAWQACGEERFNLDDLRDKRAVLSLDMSSAVDLTALTLLTADNYCWLWTWCARQALENLITAELYGVWIQQGLMTSSRGECIDFQTDVLPTIQHLVSNFKIEAIGYDRWRLENIQAIFDDHEITTPLVPVGQGFNTMSPALEKLEKLTLNKQLRHNGNPIFMWSVQNAILVRDAANSRKISKSKARDKVDPIVSLLGAVHTGKRFDESDALPTFTVL